MMNRVLVVDDDAAMRLLYTDELTEEGYDVITAGDTSRLMELIDEQRPDLVVLAMQLCEQDGVDHLERIRRVYDELPVVIAMLHANVHPHGYRRSLAADHTVEMISTLKELKRKIRANIAWRASFPMDPLFGKLEQGGTPLQKTTPELWQ